MLKKQVILTEDRTESSSDYCGKMTRKLLDSLRTRLVTIAALLRRSSPSPHPLLVENPLDHVPM
jgi:hypothetical protein